MHNGTFGHLCSQVVERDLVAARQADRTLSPQDLSRFASDFSTCTDSIFIFSCFPLPLTPFFSPFPDRLVTMGRLMSLSYGESSLSLEHWQMVKELERLRKQRLQ